MTAYRKHPLPVPNPTHITRPFWDAAREHRLVLQRCSGGHTFYYARSHCPICLSHELEWVEASGRGRLYSYTVARRPQSAEFAEDVPYIIAAITLAEGPRMTSLLVEADPDHVEIDGEVEVTWQDVEGQTAMPYVRPVR
jgi:uncharacterized OB-fold protein